MGTLSLFLGIPIWIITRSTSKERIPSISELVEMKVGNTLSGEAIFTGLCLACHLAGEQYTGIAATLDGSCKRRPDAVLTMLFLTEGGYVLFRVLEKNGTTHEGLKMKSGALGATVAFYHGETSFIPGTDSCHEEHAGSR